MGSAPTDQRTEVVRLLTSVATIAERDGFAWAGALRQVAQVVADLDTVDTRPDGCPRCGQPLPTYAGTGRRRRWCSDRCRKQ